MAFVARDIWWPLEAGDRELSTESLFDGNLTGLLGDEVMRNVVDECDLYGTYQKNRIDFDPIEVGASILLVRQSRTDWQFLRDSIRDTVQYEDSFYRRALMYNAYYQLCIQRIGTGEAERSILKIRALPVDPSITAAGSIPVRYF